jgi:hypothetical protein
VHDHLERRKDRRDDRTRGQRNDARAHLERRCTRASRARRSRRPRRTRAAACVGGSARGHGLVLRSQVHGRGRDGGGERCVEARRDEHALAARTDGGHVWRDEGNVLRRVQRAVVHACEVRERELVWRELYVRVVRRTSHEGEDVRNRPAQ